MNICNTLQISKANKNKLLIYFLFRLGPSPDWIVGVNGLNLCLKNCSWIPDLTIDLFPYDAGTDSGITYMVMYFQNVFSNSFFIS